MITEILLKLANISEEIRERQPTHEIAAARVEDLMEHTLRVANGESNALFGNRAAPPFAGAQSDPELAQQITRNEEMPKISPGLKIKDVKGVEHGFASRQQIEQALADKKVSLDGIIQGILGKLKNSGLGKSAEYFAAKPYSEQYELLLDVAEHYKILTP